jgi:hypothetical protein
MAHEGTSASTNPIEAPKRISSRILFRSNITMHEMGYSLREIPHAVRMSVPQDNVPARE